MPESPAQATMRQRLIDAAQVDERIVGLVCDGSHSAGRGDAWSDLDVSIFIRDIDFDAFSAEWHDWAAALGDLLLAYVSWVGHPWTIYAAEPVPLRVDFDLHRESTVDSVHHWPASVTSLQSSLWHDATGGRLASAVASLVGKSLAPQNLQAAFEQQCGDFWYEALYAYSRLKRGEQWVARQAFHNRTMEPLLRLLRLEAGAVDRWQASPAAADLERTLTGERLAQLDRCIPTSGAAGLAQALQAATLLGREVCASIANLHGWAWPERLAERVVGLIGDDLP